MFTLATVKTSVLDIAHVVGVATVEHLLYEAVIVRRVVARTELFKPWPVIDEDLLEDTPVPGGLRYHRAAPSWGDQIVLVKRLYHGCAASSTPHRLLPGRPHLTCLSLSYGDF